MAGKSSAKASAKKAATLSKSGLINAVVESVGDVSRRQVKAILDAMVDVGHKELKKNKIFTLPGFAKFRVVNRPATKARMGKNPFTGQDQMFAAKPASKSVRARPIKAIKDAVA